MSQGLATAEEAIEKTIANQVPAIEESEWADAPDWSDEPSITPAQEKQLADAAKQAASATEYDDTNHADDEQASSPPVQPVDEVPAGETTAARGQEKVTEKEVVEPVESSDSEPAPEFGQSLLQAAGLTADEAKIQFGTPKALENAIRLMDQRAVGVAEQAIQFQRWQEQQAAQQAAQQAGQQAAQPTQTQSTPAPAVVEFKMPKPPEGEEWDEATVALVTSLQEQFAAQLKAQQAVIQQQQQATQAILEEKRRIDLRRYVDDFDEFVDGLDEGWKPLLGKGSGFELKQDGLELKNRIQLDSVAKQLAFGRSQQGLPELSQRDLLERALRVAFPQKQEQAVRKQVEQEVSTRQRMLTNRPTGRAGGKPKLGVDAAAAYAEKWYAERGMPSLLNDEMDIDEI